MTPKLHKPGGLLALLTTVAVAAAAPVAAVAPIHPAPVYREGEVLVQYRAGAVPAQLQAAKAKLGLVAKRSIAAGRVELLKLPSPMTTRQALEVLRADPAIEHVEPNFRRLPRAVIPNDTFFSQQWGLRNTGQASGVAGADLNMTQAWDGDGNGSAERVGIPSVIVAVIDDAIEFDHPDFTPNIVARQNFIDCQDVDDPSPVSSQGSHGTLTSGCIAAVGDNGLGVAGVAWGASLMPLKFGFDTATHIEALHWARDNGAKIINASFGGPEFSQIEEDLIAELAAADILYVAAAGNSDSNTDLAQLSYPANYDADNIVSVAATDRRDNLTGFSEYGPLTVDVAAPGLQIVTTAINGGYSRNAGVSGTSFSSPYAAGVAALLKSHVSPAPDWREIKARLIESASAVAGANPKQKTRGGRIDADLALDMPDQPSLVVRAVSFDDVGGNANGLPDPAEAVSVTFTVRNLWQNAAGVTATLTADGGVTVDTVGPQALGAIAAQGEADVTFVIGIPDVTGHHYVNLTLTLSANGGAYTATRGAGFEIGTLTPGVQVAQPFTDDPYDEFHAWHVTIPAQGTTKTLFINTNTAGGEDIDLLVKRNVPPQYAITVGINPELQPGFFCTSGTAANCDDPNTLVSGRLDGTESVSIVNPAAGNYHLVVVNFDQQAVNYTVEAVLLDGDLRPEPFEFNDVSGAPSGAITSNSITVTGIDGPAPISVAGGQYSINDGTFTSSPGTVSANQTVRLRTNAGSGFRRMSVTIGGVTETFLVNPPPPPDFDSGDTACDVGSACDGFHCGSGGRLPSSLLMVLLLGVLARRQATKERRAA